MNHKCLAIAYEWIKLEMQYIDCLQLELAVNPDQKWNHPVNVGKL